MTKIPASEFEQLASGIYLEGLAVDYRRNIVWFSDVIGGGVRGLLPDGSVETLDPERMWTGGVMLNHDGAVLSSGAGGIRWNNPETGKSGWLIDQIDGIPVNGVNEMTSDGHGGIFFGTVDIEMVAQGADPRPTELFHLSARREVTRVAEGIGFTNGIMYDAARHVFYCNDTFNRTWVFDVAADLTLSKKRPFLEKDDVDGMALDAECNLWITGFRSGYITRLRPDGTELPNVDTPGEAVTQVRFGGPDMRDVYINCVPGDSGDSLKEGEIPTEQGSFLYRGRSEIPGMPIEPAQFVLA